MPTTNCFRLTAKARDVLYFKQRMKITKFISLVLAQDFVECEVPSGIRYPTQIRFSDADYKRLLDLALQHGKTKTEIIEKMLLTYKNE